MTHAGRTRLSRDEKTAAPIRGSAATMVAPARTRARISVIDAMLGGIVNRTLSPGRSPRCNRPDVTASTSRANRSYVIWRPDTSSRATARGRRDACTRISSTIAGSVSIGSRDLPAHAKAAVCGEQHIPGGASAHDLHVAHAQERFEDPADLELRQREPKAEVLTDAEPEVSARRRVAPLDVEQQRRWEDAAILCRV